MLKDRVNAGLKECCHATKACIISGQNRAEQKERETERERGRERVSE